MDNMFLRTSLNYQCSKSLLTFVNQGETYNPKSLILPDSTFWASNYSIPEVRWMRGECWAMLWTIPKKKMKHHKNSSNIVESISYPSLDGVKNWCNLLTSCCNSWTSKVAVYKFLRASLRSICSSSVYHNS